MQGSSRTKIPSDPCSLMPQLPFVIQSYLQNYSHLEAVLRTVDRGSNSFPGEMNAHQPPWAKLPRQRGQGSSKKPGGCFLVDIYHPGTSSREAFPVLGREVLFFLRLDFPGVQASRNEMCGCDLSAALSRRGSKFRV